MFLNFNFWNKTLTFSFFLKPTGSSGQDSTGVTPRKPKSSKNKTPSSSVKKPGNKKRKRKKDSDGSTEDSDYSDFEDDW